MELRELGSPVPAHTVFVSVGAIASIPIEMMRLSSNSGRQVMPLFVVFQMPPPAAATYSVFDGPGIPATSERRPMKFAGPTVRHRKPATVAESRVWAVAAGATPARSAAEARAVPRKGRSRGRGMRVVEGGRTPPHTPRRGGSVDPARGRARADEGEEGVGV